MEALRYIFSVIACMSFLWATPNSGRATEQIGIPSFHRVLVVNGTARPVVAEVQSGEVWQFIIPDFGSGVPAIVRLAVGTCDETIYSQPFAAHLDPLMADIDVNCWLARIRPAHTNQGPIIAAAESKPES